MGRQGPCSDPTLFQLNACSHACACRPSPAEVRAPGAPRPRPAGTVRPELRHTRCRQVVASRPRARAGEHATYLKCCLLLLPSSPSHSCLPSDAPAAAAAATHAPPLLEQAAREGCFDLKAFRFEAAPEQLRPPRVVRLALIQNKTVLPTTEPYADQAKVTFRA